ncbi:MAG: type I restriction enzyme HsdR N-terminal domain-containing protein [Bacteroidales bacterium]
MKQALNLPAFPFKTRIVGQQEEIFDAVRRKYVILTPEEWVRQHFVHYLVSVKSVPETLIMVEKSLVLNRMVKRADILVYGRSGNPLLMVECKAPLVKITQKTFDQVARYNISLRVPVLVVTNGMEHFCCLIDFEKSSYGFLEEIPDYQTLLNL